MKLCGFLEMEFPQKNEIEAQLLKVYKCRDKYDEETRKVIERYVKKLVEKAKLEEK